MKKRFLAATLAAACVIPLAHAQNSDFEGLSLGLGVTSGDTTTEYVHGSSLSSTNNDNNAVLQLQYNVTMTDVVRLGFGATANANDVKAGSLGSNQYKVKDAFSLYVAPGFVFTKDWEGYAKLAYLNANVKDSTGHSYSFDNGWGYGIGVQTMLGKNWFGQLEYMINQYNDRDAGAGDTIKLKSNVYSLMAGYKF